MPYIKQSQRKKLSSLLDSIKNIDYFDLDAGKINFIITTIFKNFIEVHGENYSNYNELIGVLECVKLELYRRDIANYENLKIEENGDV